LRSWKKFNTMKRIFLILNIFVCFSCAGQNVKDSSSHKFYITVFIGGNAYPHPDSIGVNHYIYYGKDTVLNNQVTNGAFGIGIDYGVTLGLKVNKYLDFETGIDYFSSSKYEVDSFTTIHGSQNNSYEDSVNLGNYTMISVQVFRIVPTLKFKIPDKRATYYLKLGLLIGADDRFTYERHIYNETKSFISDEQVTTFYDGKISTGCLAAIGIEYKLCKRLSLNDQFEIIKESIAMNQLNSNLAQSHTYSLNSIAANFSVQYNFGGLR